MGLDEIEKKLKEFDLQTKVRFGGMKELEQCVRQSLPYAKILLLMEEDTDCSVMEKLRFCLQSFRPVSVVLGKRDDFTGLFSMPDDIRGAVAVGKRSALAARFFCTLRGGYSFAYLQSPSADGLFDTAMPETGAWGGYPLREIDFAVLDTNAGQKAEKVLAHTALSAVCLQELYTDAVFCGNGPDGGVFERAISLLQGADGKGDRETADLFFASALFCMGLRRCGRFACLEGTELLKRKYPARAQDADMAVLLYYAARYAVFFSKSPRAFFVPDYAARVCRAVKETGFSMQAIRRNVSVPTGKESFNRERLFAQVKEKLGISAAVLADFADTIRKKMLLAGQKPPRFSQEELKEIYDISAELSPLMSPPSLEREFGFLPNPASAF